ncbi:MAG TPA: proline--tRNA ligase [Terriglobales bacterium]|nr:proline--tRNA ligase [Terriglobales bacterium]
MNHRLHRWSELFIPTLREAPADAEVASHKFLLRAGYVRQLSAGLYNYLFLGYRSMLKITQVVREEMDRIAQEFYLPALHPAEVWQESGRWTVMGDNMFRLKDRKGADLCLGMTEEEVMTTIARGELRSYKQLPQIWYQIQSKFRDEPRPKAGLLRVRQFTMKDAYSFDIDAAGLDVSYKKHYETYCRIFDRCGLKYVVVEAHSGAMGGSQSHEFMVYTDAGEDFVVSCPQCKYAANLEKAASRLDQVDDYAPVGDGKPAPVHTPGLKTVEDVAKFLGVSPKNKMKTMAYMAKEISGEGKQRTEREIPVVIFVRGDHQLNEAKASSAIGTADFRPMHPEEIQEVFNSPAGFLGPVGSEKFQYRGIQAKVFVDRALLGRKNLIAGANKEDYHLRNVTPGRDFQVAEHQWADLRMVSEGEGCPNCGSPLKVAKAVEIGHIFKLGYKYSQSMGLRVLDKDGKEVAPIMGSYGIGIERILTAVIEENHDDQGFWLPPNIAPFAVVVTPTNAADKLLLDTSVKIATELEQAGFDVLLDDRDERPGVKFKDADLVGIPFRITVGKKVPEGKVEVFRRSTRETQDASIAEITSIMMRLLRPQ